MREQRKAGLDIIRTIAICTIMLIHMVGYTKAMSNDIRSMSWSGYAFIKFFSAAGVPLFLLLTGYLQSSREFNKKHYVSIIPVLLSYFVISTLNAIAENMVLKTEFKIYRLVVSIFDFEYGYAWYVEMYIGLFLLIPFLNILYKNIDRNQKLWLLGILSFMSLLPSALQYFTVNEKAFEVLPDFFMNLYPFALYFIGAYIAEYKPKPNKLLCLLVFFITLIAETVLCYYYSNAEYAWWLFNNNASITHIIVAVSLFLVFYDVSAVPVISVPARLVAKCSFEMYLISYMTDNYCYNFLALPVWQIILIDFAAVFVCATVVHLVTNFVGSIIKKQILKKC